VNVIRRRTVRVLIVLSALLTLAAPSSASEVAADDFGPRQAVVETPWFTFYSHFGFNLYDAVLTSATARLRERPDPLHDGDCFAALVQEEKSAWDAAVSYYAETVAATSDFSRERAIVRAHLAGIEIKLDDDDHRDLGLSLLFLRAAAPAWRGRWTCSARSAARWACRCCPTCTASRRSSRPSGASSSAAATAWPSASQCSPLRRINDTFKN